MNSIHRMLIGLLFATVSLSSCKKLDLKKDVPRCIKQKIKSIESGDDSNPPVSAWEWKVDGKTYYYFVSDCCDQYNFLYDDQCTKICAPDGGFTGGGDGKCPKFNGQIEKTLVWEKSE